MSRIAALCVLLAVGLSATVVAAPIGLIVSVETRGEDLTGEDPEFSLEPELTYLLADTGFNVGVAWAVPVHPDLERGELELWQEYELLWPSIQLILGHSFTWIIEDEELEGAIKAVAARYIWDVQTSIELETAYAPEFGFKVIPAVEYDAEIGPGIAILGVEYTLELYQDVQFEEAVLTAGFEVETRVLTITAELLPTLVTGFEWQLAAALTLERGF